MSKIKNIKASEILDSRGFPTIKVKVQLENGSEAEALVPSGTSTGKYEAWELRDQDPKRYRGLGVLKAVSNVEDKIAKALKNKAVDNQKEIDETMMELDGTANKSNLGANAILGVSLACLKAAAKEAKISLFKYLKEYYQFAKKGYTLPIPLVNILEGGRHADDELEIQEFWVIPIGFKSFKKRLMSTVEVFKSLGHLLKESGFDTDLGFEGGYGPSLNKNEQGLEFIKKAIENTTYKFGKEFSLGIDAAASEFYNKKNKKYILKLENLSLDSEKLIKLYETWAGKYNIIALEDGFSEDDFVGWQTLTKKLGKKMMIIGDDLFVTNTQRLKWGIRDQMANAVIVKPNQIGTITETIAFIKLAQSHNYETIISHRSGETVDTFIADLAVGCDSPYIKTGSVTHSERTAKYNRLLEIEEEISNG